jgi:hypothetical protein
MVFPSAVTSILASHTRDAIVVTKFNLRFINATHNVTSVASIACCQEWCEKVNVEADGKNAG